MPRSSASTSSSTLTNSSVGSFSSKRNSIPLSKGVNDFEVEHLDKLSLKSPTYTRTSIPTSPHGNGTPYEAERTFQNNVSSLMGAKARPFSISGHIPQPKGLTVFFRSASGITHSLDFPIDVEVEAPPELDVLIAACKPHATCEMDGFSDRESLYYPPNLPLTTTIELANHPILDAVRTSLFPRLATGQHLIAIKDKMELIPTGGHMCPQRLIPREGKVATIIVTLPVRFRGGALIVHDFEGNEEKYYGRGGKPGDLEWTAFLSDCDHEVETVQRGVRLTIAYDVFLRTFGPSPSPSQSLMLPSDRFLDLISPILNQCRGQTIAFYLREQYGFSPADVLAESLVPYLKAGDALLYHSLRLYKLVPELRWCAGGYVWPVDSAVECGNLVHSSQRHPRSPSLSLSMSPSSRQRRAVANAGFSIVRYDAGSDSDDDAYSRDPSVIRSRVESSGATSITKLGIKVLADDTLGGSVTKERVPYISSGSVDRLIVNVLLVVFVP